MQDLATTFAGYRLLDAIGRDAVSRTYRATAADGDGRPVALQVSAPLTDGVERRHATLFQRRATAAMDVEHPGIARVIDADIADDRAYTVTAWQPSLTLDQLIGQRWRLSVQEAVTLLAPAAEGLDRAHTAGVVHAALGPRSIRVTTDPRPTAFVTGFGFHALLALRLGSKRERDAGAVLDDMLYVAPELLRGEPIEPATDQYALACAMYHCLTGEPPFVRDTASALFGAHLFARPDVHAALTDPDNAAARAAIATGLAKEPGERHGSCAALVRAADVTSDGSAEPDMMPAPTVAPVTHEPADSTATPDPSASKADDVAGTSRPGILRSTPLVALVAVAAIAGLVAALALIASVRGDSADLAPADGVARPDARAQADRAGAGGDAGGVAAADATQPALPRIAVAWRRPVGDARVLRVGATADAIAVIAGDTVALVDPATGDARWRASIDDGRVTDAAVSDDALVYRTTSGMTAIAIDDGRRLWTRDDQYTPTGGLHSVASGEQLYGMGPGRILPELMAMDPATGVERWHFHGEEVAVRQNAAVAADDELVTILQGGTLFGLAPDAELYPSGADRLQIEDEVFRVDVARPWRDSVALLDDAILLARRNGAVCNLARADAVRRWCRRIDDVKDARPRLLAGGDAVIVVTRSAVTALDRATGERRWRMPAGGRITAATTTGATVVIAEREGRVRGLDLTSGEVRWRTGQRMHVTAMAPVGNTVVIGTKDGAVLRLARAVEPS